MSMYEINQVLDIATSEGIWVEEKDNHWYFMIQDEKWYPEEIKRFEIEFLRSIF